MRTALVAGRGRLPAILRDRYVFDRVAALEDDAPDIAGIDTTFRVETLGTFVADLRAAEIERICFAGAIRRPEIDPARIDAATMPLVSRLMAAVGQGDDAALRIVLSIFEEAGVAPVGAHALLPDLLPAAGVLIGSLTAQAKADADRAAWILSRLGAADIGQSCIVAGGQALAVEAMPGTDWMLATIAAGRDKSARMGAERAQTERRTTADLTSLALSSASGGILFKTAKPDQDRRVDLPAIGPDTIRRAILAGLDGVVIGAGDVMVLDLEETLAAASEAGLFVWVREA